MTILIVEDDEALRNTLAAEIEFSDIYAICAVNGQDALNYLRVCPPPTLILLDLAMPVMNGWEFRKAQLADPELSTIPVIVSSAFHWSAQQKEELNATGYLNKPFNLCDLEAMIERIRLELPEAEVTNPGKISVQRSA